MWWILGLCDLPEPDPTRLHSMSQTSDKNFKDFANGLAAAQNFIGTNSIGSNGSTEFNLGQLSLNCKLALNEELKEMKTGNNRDLIDNPQLELLAGTLINNKKSFHWNRYGIYVFLLISQELFVIIIIHMKWFMVINNLFEP